MKVYCGNCKYYVQWHRIVAVPIEDRCIAPENLGDTYMKPKSKCMQHPSIINQHNDCYYFESNPKSKMIIKESQKKWWRAW